VKKGFNFSDSTPPPPRIGLQGNDFPIKKAFNKGLKLLEFVENFRLMLKKINLGKFAKIIDETHIVFISAN
jgi:hypothetical protein